MRLERKEFPKKSNYMQLKRHMGGFYKLNTESLLCASAGMMADHIFFSRPLLKLCNIIVRCISKKQLKSVKMQITARLFWGLLLTCIEHSTDAFA